MKEKFYISTAIAYTSAKPHIGNVYEVVLADSIARYKRQQGFDVYFQTGTDEHGQKIEEKAKECGKEPQKFVDDLSLEVRRLWDGMNTSYDKFVRTTNPNHEKVVSKIFEKLYKNGDIYKGVYKGLYCTPCESFWTESQLVDGKCPDCGREVQITEEEAYFLKLSNYSSRLEKYIEDNPDFIQPESRKNEILNNFIRPGLQDLCVSRTSFKWGIPVTFDENHVIYVWIDALSNYITFLGYDVDSESEEFKKYWPADLHLIGKDIIRFHTIYWPIILMALNLEMPKKIFAHPWLMFGNDKMSKSKGNIIYSDDLVKEFGVDAVRYFLLAEIPYSSDGTITYELLIDRINSDLANTLGNLLNRTISMSYKYFEGIVYESQELEEIDVKFREFVTSVPKKVDILMNEIKVSDSIEKIMEMFRKCNKYIDETTPWILAKEENFNRLKTVMYNLLEAIRIGAVMLQPYLPETSDEIFRQLNTKNKFIDNLDFSGMDNGIKLNEPKPLFIRIDKTKKLEELLNKN